jgi:integral membrane protein
MNALAQLRVANFLEGTSFLLLLGVAMPLKYLAHLPEAVRVAGSVHGLLFLVFVSAVLRVSTEHAWPRRRALWAVTLSLLPFGTFVLDRALRAESAPSPR